MQPPRNHLFNEHPPYSDFDPLFFLKKKGGQIWLCWYWFRGGGGPGKFYESSARAPGPGNCVPERNETSGERVSVA